jgi:HEAT repeat protein
LVDLAIDSVRKERFDIVADVFHGLVVRENKTDDKVAKRLFGLCIRRLSTPTTLRCITELLPRRQDQYERYLEIFTRAEDVGAEALVDALISAPSIVNRRVYYDALLRVRTGARTLVHMLGDPRWYVVRNAVDLLGEMRMTEAEDELTRLLEHQDDRVRTAAASALAKLGTAAGALGARAARHDALAREQMVGSAEGAGKSMFVDSLIRALEREEDSRVQMTMLASLAQLGTPLAIEKLTEIARSETGLLGRKRPMRLRVAAVHVLGDVRSAGALAALRSLLRDKEKDIRGAASWVMMGRKREGGEEE